MNCKIDGCDKTNKMTRGYCAKHYENWRTTGNPLSKREQTINDPKPVCRIEDCDNLVKSKELCGKHYENLRKYGNEIPKRDLSIEEKIEDIGWKETPTGCWEWNGAKNSSGYGVVTLRRAKIYNQRVHRLVYQIHNGDLHSDLVVRHKCDNPPCVNPEHLEIGTHSDNMNDMSVRNRSGHSYENRNNRCPNGHIMTDPISFKVITKKNGYSYRTCVECAKARSRRYADKMKLR